MRIVTITTCVIPCFGKKSSQRHNCFCRRSCYVPMWSLQVQNYPPTNALPIVNSVVGLITVNSKYTCTCSNVVYLIKCHAYSRICIGETGRCLRDRFSEHLHFTRQTNNDLELPVGRHFALPGHDTDDMLVPVIRSGFQDPMDRRPCTAVQCLFPFGGISFVMNWR